MLLEKPSSKFYREFEPTKEDLLILREWIAKTPYIVQDYDDYMLSAIIRSKKGSIQKAKEVIENFSALGHRYPKYLCHLDPLDKIMQTFLNAHYIHACPKRTDDGSAIFALTTKKDPEMDLSVFNYAEFFRLYVMATFVLLWGKVEGNTKIILIYDATHEKLAKFRHVTPSFVRDLLYIMENIPSRVQAFHIVNAPSFVEPLINFAKTFIKSKLVQRVSSHSNVESLWEKVPRELLPKEYGGSQPSVKILHDSWKKTIESYRDKLIEESNKMRKLDPLRPKSEEHQEMEGTFRYLFPLPKRTEDGTIICMLAAKSDPDGKFNHSWYEFHRIWLMSIFVHVWEGITDTTRIILVYDCTYESLSRCKDVTPTFLRDVFTMLETSPTRVRGIHVVNMPSFCEPIFDIAKMLMKSKIIQRLHVHRDMNSLFEYVPRKYLPEEYGGCEASMRALHDLWKKKIESYRDKLIKENDKMRKRDPLRPRSKEHDEEMEGTFRQLRID